jgi:hypothetical protein
MSELSNFLEGELYDHVMRNLAYTAPATLYLALFTTDPTDADSGAEVSGGSYARETVAFGAPTDGVGSNSSAVTFTTASAAWGTVTHFGIYDAVSAGNLLFHTILTASKVVGDGDTFKVNSGDLTVTWA